MKNDYNNINNNIISKEKSFRAKTFVNSNIQ